MEIFDSVSVLWGQGRGGGEVDVSLSVCCGTDTLAGASLIY